MIPVRITEADIRNCDPYIPLMDKTLLVMQAADVCIVETKIKGDDGQPLPSMWRENKNLSARALMGVLAKRILGKEIAPVEGTEYIMSADEYDKWAGGYVINQIERFKSNPELRDKCFDILYEYREVERWLRAEIRANIEAMNDAITRGGDLLRSSMTPKAMQALTDNMNEIGKMAEELKARNNA